MSHNNDTHNKENEKVTQLPNMPTHSVVSVEVLGELLNLVGNKLTWMEANPIMAKMQEDAVPVVLNEDGTGFTVLTQPPKA